MHLLQYIFNCCSILYNVILTYVTFMLSIIVQRSEMFTHVGFLVGTKVNTDFSGHSMSCGVPPINNVRIDNAHAYIRLHQRYFVWHNLLLNYIN